MERTIVVFILLVVLLIGIFTQPSQAAYEYSGKFIVSCEARLVKLALEHLYVTGKMWKVFPFAPAYDVTRAQGSDTIHVSDPSSVNIRADVWLVASTDDSLVWGAQGTVDYPVLRGYIGDVKMSFYISPKQDKSEVMVKIEVNMREFSAQFTLWSITLMLNKFIDNRLSYHFRDLGGMLTYVKNQPQGVVAVLQGKDKQEFERIFVHTPESQKEDKP